MSKVRHVLGISGGKDSTALALYLEQKYGSLDLEYYFCDTGKELMETYDLLQTLETVLGTQIKRLKAAGSSHKDPFDHFLEVYGGFLPSSGARWCTKKLKLEPFEAYVGDDPVISYVGIRHDEDREGYISRKPNIQSIFPFRKNIWSEDVISRVLANGARDVVMDLYHATETRSDIDRIKEVLLTPLSLSYHQEQKLHALLDLDIRAFNQVVHQFIKEFTDYPLALVDHFPLIDNDEALGLQHIFSLLERSGVGLPGYYDELPFQVDGKTGKYFRSRSGCYFCFFQQKIEWVWLHEQHPEQFEKAMAYEKAGYSWMDNETLEELIRTDRIRQIKTEFLQKAGASNRKSALLLDLLPEEEGCAACFI